MELWVLVWVLMRIEAGVGVDLGVRCRSIAPTAFASSTAGVDKRPHCVADPHHVRRSCSDRQHIVPIAKRYAAGAFIASSLFLGSVLCLPMV